ncbi:MAG: hypothetical protein M1472_04720 [Planctomycetes bacterium]|nr:hypothetical protein [Planctomycetota bacterium]MDA8378144.1 hypothetical protein [Planctomycetia bacterium]
MGATRDEAATGQACGYLRDGASELVPRDRVGSSSWKDVAGLFIRIDPRVE